jgi:Domain of unknown function (DUF4331)
MRTNATWRRRAGFVLAAGVVAASVYGFGPAGATASSHREAPLVAADPAIDNTDVYAFRSPDNPDTVTLIGNWIPFEEPNGGPNFYPFAADARYNMHVDNDGNGEADVTMRFTFKNIDKRGRSTFLYNNGPITSINDENLLFRQTVTMETSIDGENWIPKIKDAPVAPSLVGPASVPDYRPLRDQAITSANGWKLYAGQADDPFFLDLRVFDLLYGGNLSEVGQDTVQGYNVNTIAVQVPMKELALKGDPTRNPVIGVWMTTERLSDRSLRRDGTVKQDGDWVQVSRLGNPLVNEVIMPAATKDQYNATPPRRDKDIPGFFDRIANPEVPQLVKAFYGVPAPATPRDDLSEIFLTGITTKSGDAIDVDLNSQLNNADVRADRFVKSEMLRLNMSTPVTASPNRLGVLQGDLQGFPNGRRLTDDVLDIELQALEGAARTGVIVDALKAGDKVDKNNVAFGTTFPFLGLPNSIAVNQQPTSTPTSGGMLAPAGGAALLGGTAILALWWRRHRRAPR